MTKYIFTWNKLFSTLVESSIHNGIKHYFLTFSKNGIEITVYKIDKDIGISLPRKYGGNYEIGVNCYKPYFQISL